jgi:hypothetical protein
MCLSRISDRVKVDGKSLGAATGPPHDRYCFKEPFTARCLKARGSRERIWPSPKSTRVTPLSPHGIDLRNEHELAGDQAADANVTICQQLASR